MNVFVWSAEVETLIAENRIDELEKVFLNYEGPESANPEFWLYKGEVFQKLQKWGIALNSFLKVIELDPDNKSAKSNIEIIKSILNFWNPEMFNA